MGLVQGFALARPLPAATIDAIWAAGGRLDETLLPAADGPDAGGLVGAVSGEGIR